MEKIVTMPKLGMTMEEGEVLNWRYEEGEWVEKGEPLVEVMTDKVNIEVEAPFDGRLIRILAREGAILPVGAPIASLNDEKGEPSSASSASSAPSQATI
ncbi:MAG TPA: biotin/lipoyl-containing protein, partial [Ktedonobacteraceae bacterium]|nr:biotin/lipoyl-containing protein [Ktedonobacteraceae bacterium]